MNLKSFKLSLNRKKTWDWMKSKPCTVGFFGFMRSVVVVEIYYLPYGNRLTVYATQYTLAYIYGSSNGQH